MLYDYPPTLLSSLILSRFVNVIVCCVLGYIPTQMGELTALTDLRLHRNKLSGSCTHVTVQSIFYLFFREG